MGLYRDGKNKNSEMKMKTKLKPKTKNTNACRSTCQAVKHTQQPSSRSRRHAAKSAY
jgi:hypothetical protein